MVEITSEDTVSNGEALLYPSLEEACRENDPSKKRFQNFQTVLEKLHIAIHEVMEATLDEHGRPTSAKRPILSQQDKTNEQSDEPDFDGRGLA